MQRLNLISIFAPLVFTTACGDSIQVTDVNEVAEYWNSALFDNGLNLNGINLNGLNLNGLNLNGLNLNGLNLNGLNLNGVSLQQVSLEGTSLQGDSDGRPAADVQLSGARLTGQLSNAKPAELRIDSVTWSNTSQVYLYNVSIRHDNGWSPLCGTANGLPIPTIPTAGQWNLTDGSYSNDGSTFTFACVNAAIGKCVQWGYQPWATKKECKGDRCRDQPLSAWLQACTRMVRADYCGDGVAHTRNGTVINVWDQLGIQKKVDSSLRFEAEWAQDGAHCIAHTRWVRADDTSSQTDAAYVRQNCSKRIYGNEAGCGWSSSFSTDRGLDQSLETRHLLRNESALNQ